MGAAMAERLASQGVAVVVYNRSRERAAALAERIGATVASTPAEAAAAADVTISMVADDAAVRALFEGPDGVAAGIRPGSVAVDCSTVLPDTIRSVAGAVQATGAGILDAPVSGSVSSTLSGELTIMVGGEAADLDRARPVLERLARRVFHLGPLGTGAAMKLAVNTLIFGLNECVAEGLVLAERNGIDRALAYDVLAASAAGAPFVGYKRDAFVEPDDDSRGLLPGARRQGPAAHRRPGRGLRDGDAAGGRQPRGRHRRGGIDRQRRRFLESRQPPASGGPAMTDRP